MGIKAMNVTNEYSGYVYRNLEKTMIRVIVLIMQKILIFTRD